MSSLREFLGSKVGLVVCLALAVLGAYLLWSHTGHVLSALPYVLLLACPLLHLFGHGHGQGQGHAHDGDRTSRDSVRTPLQS
jgi:hypothetical protein